MRWRPGPRAALTPSTWTEKKERSARACSRTSPSSTSNGRSSERPSWEAASSMSLDLLPACCWSRHWRLRHDRTRMDRVAATDRPENYGDDDQRADGHRVGELEVEAAQGGVVGAPGRGEQPRPQREEGRRGDPEHGQNDADPGAGVSARYNERPLDVGVL